MLGKEAHAGPARLFGIRQCLRHACESVGHHRRYGKLAISAFSRLFE